MLSTLKLSSVSGKAHLKATVETSSEPEGLTTWDRTLTRRRRLINEEDDGSDGRGKYFGSNAIKELKKTRKGLKG